MKIKKPKFWDKQYSLVSIFLLPLTFIIEIINLFPKFREIKENDKDWLDFIYLKNDIHLTKNGNKLVAQEIEINSF